MMAMEMNERIDTLIRKLRESGLRITPQRIEIIRMLLELSTHPSADAVYRQVRLRHPSISLATVYSTLDMLARLGALQEVGGSGERRFDGRSLHPHAHLVCRQCGEVTDMSLPSDWQDLRERGQSQDFCAEALQVTLTGLCAVCRSSSGE